VHNFAGIGIKLPFTGKKKIKYHRTEQRATAAAPRAKFR
jgi:hypothetical protein